MLVELLSFTPELPAKMMSLSELAGNYWTSKPVGRKRFEMLLLPLRAIGVINAWAVVVLLVISGAVRAAPASDGERDSPPPFSGQLGIRLDSDGWRIPGG